MVVAPRPDAAPAVPEALVPPEPTLRLPKNFVPTGYDVTLAIDPAKPTFDGTIAIAGTVAERSSAFWLHGRHLTIHAATIDTVPAQVTPHGEDLLEITVATPIEAGAATFHFTYTGEIDLVNTTGMFVQEVPSKHYVFSQLEAIYARRVFPCVDEPDSKVPWHVTLDVPKDLVAVSNTPVEHEAPLDDTHKRVEFAPTKPLPSYLIAFGVGPFEIVDAGKTRSGIPVRAIVLAGRADDAAWTVKTTPKILDLEEEWFGIPYPYEKMDVMSIPLTVGFGAMENAGLVTFTENLMLFDQKHPSREREHAWVVVCAHELAHQWFGDLVTMAWWDDIWLNEGFANWLEHEISARFEVAWHDELAEVDVRGSALAADALTTARRVRQPIASTDDIYNVFDGITYDKGASILNMFESYVGKDSFQAGIRAYLHARAFGNATVTDFVDAIGKASNREPVPAGGERKATIDVSAAFATFLDQGGAPEITASVTCTGGKPRLELAQHRYVPQGAAEPPPGKPWIVPICATYDKDGARAEACTLLDGDTGTLALDGKRCPRWAMANVRGRGYYHLALTAPQAIALRDEAWPQLSWAERRVLFGDVRSLASQGKLPLQLALSFVPALLAGGNRFVVADALGYATGFDFIVPAELRGKYEAWLRATFGAAATKVGLVPADGEDLDAQAMRGQLVGAVAAVGRDPALIADAVKLGDRWHDLSQASRGQVLALAVDADPALFDRILHDVYSEPSRARRGEMMRALAGVHDVERQKRALPLVLDPKLDIRETIGMVYATPTPANVDVAAAFVRAHDAELLARPPARRDTSGQSIGLASIFIRSCDAAKRDDAATYIKPTFASIPGSDRSLQQDLEAMDQCIARRAALDPELRGWLTGVKIPRPPEKKAPQKKAPKSK